MTPPAKKRFHEFNSFWTYENERNRVRTLLQEAGVHNPDRYNQLMVAYDQVAVVYAIYASGGRKCNGKPFYNRGTQFELVFDRGNLNSEFY